MYVQSSATLDHAVMVARAVTPDDAAKIAADHTYATWFPPLVIALIALVIVGVAWVALVAVWWPRTVRVGRSLVGVITASRASEGEAHAEILAEVRDALRRLRPRRP